MAKFRVDSQELREVSDLHEDKKSLALHQLVLLAWLDLSDDLNQLQLPVMALFAESDALVPLFAQAAFKKHFPHLRSRCVLNSSHAFILSQAPTLMAEFRHFLSASHCAGQLRSKRRIEQSFAKASTTYDRFAHLQRDVASRMLRWAPELGGRVLDLGCGTGYVLQQLAEREKFESGVGLDLALPMLQQARQHGSGQLWAQADIENLCFSDQSFDALTSSLAIQWCDDLARCFSEAHRVLRPNGLFLLSSLGPETLCELRLAWQQADAHYEHVNQFVHSTAVIEAALQAGFELELFAQEWKVLHYDKLSELMAELKGIGAHNVNRGARSALMGKSTLVALTEAYEQQRDENRQLPATYEVYFLMFKKRSR